MKINVKVKPGARNEQVTRVDDGHLIVSVKEPPVEGKANEALIRVLSEYLNVPKNCIQILRGGKGRNKVVEIL